MPRAGHRFPDKKVDYMSKRLEKLKRVEEAKIPEERLVNRDWDDEVERQIGILNAIRHRAAKRHFIELATCEHVRICETAEEAEAFFTKDGLPFTCSILKKFAEAFALSSNGTIADVPTVRSIHYLLLGLFSACKVSGKPIDRDVKRNILLWVQSDLAVRGLATHKQRQKDVALPADFSALLRAFLSTEYLTATQYATRNVLNFLLLANMMLDCSSRISELTRPALSNADWETYSKERKENFFTWRRVELWAFPGVDVGVELRARLTFCGLKNTGQKGNKVKVIPIRLLPLHMAAEDTMRWLLILGLIDGVFEGISRWEDLDAVQPSQYGTSIPIKKSMLDTPVFRQPVHKPTDPSSSLLETTIMRSSHFVSQLKQLGVHCGLQNPMLPGVLRRGSAYLQTSHAERCARMGHDDKDTTYWGAYRNATSTVDFQALRHNLSAVDVSQMSSVFLGKSEAAPTRVSEQGMIAISQDAELLELLKRECDIIDQMVRDFGSMSAARARGDPKVSEQVAIHCRYQERERFLLLKRFKEEYQEHFDNARYAQPTELSTHVDRMLDVEDSEDIPIDPLLLQDTDNIAIELGQTLEADHQLVEMQPVDVSSTLTTESAKALHAAGTVIRNNFGLRETAKHSLFTGLSDMIYDQPEGLSAAGFADFCVEKFNHLHAADKYYPGMEPLPGTLSCRFCGRCLIGIDHNQHIRPCAADTMAKQVLADLDDHQASHPPNQKCGMIGLDGVQCKAKYKLTRDVKSYSHFTEYCNKRHTDATGQFLCTDDGTTFSSWNDFRIHRVTQHAASTTVIPVDKNTGNPRAEILVFWCKICQHVFSRLDQNEDQHFMNHVGEVQGALAEHGFSGKHVSFVWHHPSFCIFCLYNGNAGLSTQFADFYTTNAFVNHLKKHIRDLEEDVAMACPAATDTANGIGAVCHHAEPMSKTDLIAHLIDEHGLAIERNDSVIPIKATLKRKRPALEDKNVNEGIQAASGSTRTASKHVT